MELPVFLPNLRTKSTKNLILRLLTERAAMTNQQCFLEIKNRFGVSVTYQAVRQALVELTQDGVLTKKKREYSIAIEWIRDLHDFSSLLKRKYIDERQITIVDKDTTEIRLASLNDLGHFMLYSFRDQFFDMEREGNNYIYVHHLWFPFFSGEKRRKLTDFFESDKNHILVRHNTVSDRVLSLYYKRFGRVKLGAKLDGLFDIFVQGDCVVKILMPKELRDRMDKAYRSKNPFNFKILDEVGAFTFDPYPIKIVVTRDREMAEEIRAQMRTLL